MVSIPATDIVDYIFQFDSFGAAVNDPTIGSSFITPVAVYKNKEVWVYSNTSVNSAVAETGYWFILTELGLNFTLVNHPNIRIINDLTRMFLGQTSLAGSSFDTTFLNVIISNFSGYCGPLFPIIGVYNVIGNSYVAEDGVTFYVAEDGVTGYVQES